MRVFVAMSGGVDSSVAAALCLEAGHEVTGVTMRLLPGDLADGSDSDDAVNSARGVCDRLGIPHRVLDCRDVFEREVVGPFAARYAAGGTPNPCIACNDRVKFKALFSRARDQGAEAFATGHYARIVRDDAGTAWLARGVDPGKDQSYFLYRLNAPVIEHVLFPVGEMDKSAVRERAAALGLPSAERPDSQEVCFVKDGQHPSFVIAREPQAGVPGEIVNARGVVLGNHRGLAHYTVGQRKGLGIAAPNPLYVVSLDAGSNRIVVGEHQELGAVHVVAHDAVWRLDTSEARVGVQTRYRMDPVPGTASFLEGTLTVVLDTPIPGVAPGQAVVCYVNERVVAGGAVQCAHG